MLMSALCAGAAALLGVTFLRNSGYESRPVSIFA